MFNNDTVSPMLFSPGALFALIDQPLSDSHKPREEPETWNKMGRQQPRR